jgi:hypothetical protein
LIGSVLRTNRNFRLLLAGQAVSQLGDWFNSVAVFALLLDLTGSATAVAWMMILQFLPMAIVGPVAGVVVDRVDRRRLMIAADLIRGVLVLGLLLVRRPDQIWMAYLVMGLTMSAAAFFEPARTATIPNVTAADELIPANAISSAAWSVMIAAGASIGGLVTAVFGRDAAFVINAASFIVSAILISRTKFDAAPSAGARRGGVAMTSAIRDLREGLRYVRQHSHVGALILVKAGWGLAGGVLLLLTVFGQRIFPVGDSTAAGIGVVYGARGIGAGLGPFALRWVIGRAPGRLRATIAPAYFAVGLFYAALAVAGTLPLAALAVLCAHFFGSVLWVFSTVLLQIEVPDRFRGRVFSAELALVTITSSVASFATAYALDRAGWSPRALSLILGTLFAVPGVLWLLLIRGWKEGGPSPVPEGKSSVEEDALEARIG